MKSLRELDERQAFTLIELLVVVAIIMLLAGLLFPAFNHAREVAKRTRAKTEVKQLETAWRAVLSDYRGWPAAIGPSPSGRDMDSAAVAFLQGGNSKGVIYMEFDGSATNSAGAFIDPWYHATRAPNNRYRASLGTGVINPPHGQVSREVGAWSLGKDGKENSTDDVKSWD